MKKLLGMMLAIALCVTCAEGLAATGWTVPNNQGSGSGSGYGNYSYTTTAKLVEDLATRTGPSTAYTGAGSYKMKGQTVTVLTRAYDNGGVMWVEIEFTYGGGYRRAWTGAKRLNLSSSQLKNLPEEDFSTYIGYGTMNTRTSPRFGPGSIFATYGDRDLYRGDRVVVIAEIDGYYKVECYYQNEIFRSYVPAGNVNLD